MRFHRTTTLTLSLFIVLFFNGCKNKTTSTVHNSVEVNGSMLTTKKDGNIIVQAWVVNGHVLPPEPDPTVNDSTLLGIDINNNGVRDDVERKVYSTYSKAIQRAVMMQAFRVEQKMLADPDMVDNARIWEKKISKPLNCRRYLYLYKGQPRIKKMASITDDWQYNNKERVKLYIDYNKALSGGVYSLGKAKLDDCEFNIDKVLKMDE